MNKDISFGVACFHFWPQIDVPFTLDIDDYCDHLRDALEAIPTISNIEIDADSETPDIEVSRELSSLSDGEDFLPHPSFFETSFDVYIPYRIQEQLTENGMGERTYTENFRIITHYAYEAPVTFVECLHPSEKPEPSQAVRVVREYIEREINLSGGNVKFDVLGPSPFHADFYIRPQIGKDFIGFEVQHNRTRAYDEITFDYNETDFPSTEGAKLDLLTQLEDELGFFYHLILTGLKANQEWQNIKKLLSKLIDVQGKRPRMQRILSALLRGRYINQLFTAIISLEVNQISRRNLIDEGYRGIYSKSEPTYLKFYVDECLKELMNYPTKEVAEVAKFLEGRRSKRIELIIILLAALVGGITGSLLTILLTRPS